jgi:excinuclease ABC subunit C
LCGHQKISLHSCLEEIAGIGPRRRAQLLQHFGGLRQIAEATLDDLQLVPGISLQLARTIKEMLATYADS